MRLIEALRVRVQDIDFDTNEITVHCGKGAKDRKTMLPVSLKFPLQNHLEHVCRIHEEDCKDGFGSVPLPSALAKKYPNAGKMWARQWVFPQARRWRNKGTGGIISILRLFSELCMKPFCVRVFRSPSAVIRSATPLQHTYWNPAMIFVLFKSFLVTVMLKPLWFTLISSSVAVLVLKGP